MGPGVRLLGFLLPAFWSRALFSTCVILSKSLNLLIHTYLVLRINKVAVFQHLDSAWPIVSTR